MLIYLDESYDNAHSFFLLGALFIPKSKALHRAFKRAKLMENYVLPSGEVREVKYSRLESPRQLRIAMAGVDLFLNSDAWFRCIVVDQRPTSGWSFDSFGQLSEPRPVKEARVYKHFTEMLLGSNRTGVVNGVLLTDRLVRTRGDDFLRAIRDAFSTPSQELPAQPVLGSVQSVDTGEERYHLGQIGDLLTGAVLNDLIDRHGTRGRFKREFREYLKEQVGAPSLGPSYWAMPQYLADATHPKFQVWHWRPAQ